MKKTNKRPTIKDVAKKAGVTATTISLALHNNKSIPPKTRERIFKIIKEMNYYPNYAARSLVGGKTNTIALLADFFSTPFMQTMLNGIEKSVVGTRFNLVQYSAKGLPEMEEELFNRVLHGRTADALIAFNMRPGKKIVDAYNEAGFPVIMVEGGAKNLNTVTCDNVLGGRIATEFLIKKARKKIAIVTGKQRHKGAQEDRLAGYKKALEENNLEFDPKNIIETEKLNFNFGRNLFLDVISIRKDIDAVFCAAGDAVAIGIMYEAQKTGVKIPDSLAVIGYDDLEPAIYVKPSLTTVRQPGFEMGRKAVLMAAALIEKWDPKKKENIILTPELIERESS